MRNHPLYSRYSSEQLRSILGINCQDIDFPHASAGMKEIFSSRARLLGWRRIWVTLAREQASLGLNIEPAHIQAMEDSQEDLDLERVRKIESETRHDVMAALREFREKVEARCPGAGSLLHAGGTSCLVTDNQELISIRSALTLLMERIQELKKVLPQGLMSDSSAPNLLDEICTDLKVQFSTMKARGAKGTTGTQASYLQLFGGDHEKVRLLDRQLAQALGFENTLTITSQTYPRVVDYQVLSLLQRIGTVLDRFFGHFPEFARLNMELERLAQSCCEMAANQWIERSLDDSSTRRILFYEAFLTCDQLVGLCLTSVSKAQFRETSDKLLTSKRLAALDYLKTLLYGSLEAFEDLAMKTRDLACLGFTHYQIAQPTTYGKRVCLWSYQLILTQELFEQWESSGLLGASCDEQMAAFRVESLLNQWMIGAHKIALDLRLLQHDEELNEPFGADQIGSSAMAYKKNPMKSERINGLARLKWGLYPFQLKPDDALLCTESVLRLIHSIFAEAEPMSEGGFAIHEGLVSKHLREKIPFLASERILMDSVQSGADRQEVHEVMRRAMLQSRKSIEKGNENPFLEILTEQGFNTSELSSTSDFDLQVLVGRSVEQVLEFCREEFQPRLQNIQNRTSFEKVEV